MGNVRLIMVSGHKVGINGLDQVIEDMGEAFAAKPDGEVGQEMLRRLKGGNYFPDAAGDKYAAGLAREYRKALGQPVEEERSAWLEVQVLGTGCTACHGMHELVMQVAANLGLAADVELVTDAMEIAALGVRALPSLVVNGKVVFVGQVPSESQIAEFLKEAE